MGANGFVSGNELFGDFTAVYKIGKWQIGPVAYFEAQTTADKLGGGVACTPARNHAEYAVSRPVSRPGELFFFFFL